MESSGKSTYCRNLQVPDLANSILALLASQRPSDAISEELAELLGFDNFDLAADILANRPVILAEASIILVASLLVVLIPGSYPGTKNLSTLHQPFNQRLKIKAMLIGC
jgi:hypothetical protein